MSSKKFNALNLIWIAVPLLLALVIASVALLATMLKSQSVGEKNVIALFPSDMQGEDVFDVTQVPAEPEVDVEMGNQTGGSNSGASGNPGEIVTEKPTWEATTQVDLFSDTYLGPDGKITVQSFNGDKLIAPGTSNEYEFSLKNTGNISLDYTLSMDSIFQFGEVDLPITVRMRCGDRWMLGDEETWGTLEQLKKVTDKQSIARGKYITYTFEWQWPFEYASFNDNILDDLNDALVKADQDDTTLGNAATDTGTRFDLDINTVTSITPGAVPVDETGADLFKNIFKKVPVEYVGLYVVLILVAAIGLVVLFILLGILFKRRLRAAEAATAAAVAKIPKPTPAKKALVIKNNPSAPKPGEPDVWIQGKGKPQKKYVRSLGNFVVGVSKEVKDTMDKTQTPKHK